MKFSRYIKSFKTWWRLATLASVAGPLALWTPDLHPPWPTGAAAIATLFCVVAILLAYIIGRYIGEKSRSRSQQKVFKRNSIIIVLASIFLILSLCLSITYLYVYSSYVVVVTKLTKDGEQALHFIVGAKIRDNINPKGKTKKELLLDNLLEPEKVWTFNSIRTNRLLLLFSFVLMFFFLTLGFALLVSLSLSVENITGYSKTAARNKGDK